MRTSQRTSAGPIRGHGIPAARPLFRPAGISADVARSMTVSPAAGSQTNIKVVGVGSAGLDYLAQIAAWPNPDDKLRTEKLETQGGGNCANAITAAARLGLRPFIVSKIGDDGIGDQIVSELQNDGVNTEHMLRAENSPSPFTYIIVDREGGTRTCIHTPSAPLMPEELKSRYNAILSDAALVYFDGRLTEAALPLARAARNAGLPVLVEAERLRPNLEALLAEADYVTTSAKFPQAWTGEETLGAALVSMLQRLPVAEWALTTLGAKGAVLLQRAPNEQATGQAVLDDLLPQLWEELDRRKAEPQMELACSTADGTQIMEGAVVHSGGAYRLLGGSDPAAREATASRAELAAAQEAQKNAAVGIADGYRMHSADASRQNSGQDAIEQPAAEVIAKVFVSSAAQLPKEAVRDTTGAGDASVGTLLFGICHGMEIPAMLKLAAVVSAAKCTGMGARSALPRRDDLLPRLLS